MLPKRRSTLLLLAAMPFAVASSLAAPAAEDKQQRKQEAVNQAHALDIEAAKKAATDWLSAIDASKYEESWKQAAPFLQTNLSQTAWEKRLDQTRKPLGPFIDRTLQTTQYREQLPGLPPGHYVALVWESYFGAKRQMLESVIMADDAGHWKPVGYAVQ